MPGEVPAMSRKYFQVSRLEATGVLIKPTFISTSDGLRSFDPKQRQCFFSSERKLRFFKGDSLNILSKLNGLMSVLFIFFKFTHKITAKPNAFQIIPKTSVVALNFPCRVRNAINLFCNKISSTYKCI